MIRQGRFAGPVAGLRFETSTCAGVTAQDGTFQYRDGEVVSFSVGAVILGAARGADRLTIADIVARVDGNLDKLADPTSPASCRRWIRTATPTTGSP
jgi:hypothetical protein